MRMWMISPKLLCNKHLLGEHGELHKFLPSFKKKHKIDRRISPVVQIELSSYKKRHDELALEIEARFGAGHHKSPLEIDDNLFSYLPPEQFNAKVDLNTSIRDLCLRCKDCAFKLLMNDFDPIK